MEEKGKAKMTEMIFSTRISKWIAGMYWSILAFLVFMLVAIPLLVEMKSWEKILFLVIFLGVLVMFLFIMAKAYRMRFTVEEDQIIVSGIFKKNRIKIDDIKSIDKVPIPVGIKLFGASCLGGWYYLPGIGKAWVAMGNFQDGVLIKTKQDRHYVITPQEPLRFIQTVKARMT